MGGFSALATVPILILGLNMLSRYAFSTFRFLILFANTRLLNVSSYYFGNGLIVTINSMWHLGSSKLSLNTLVSLLSLYGMCNCNYFKCGVLWHNYSLTNPCMQLLSASRDLLIAAPSIYVCTFCLSFWLEIRSLPAKSIILNLAKMLSYGNPLTSFVT